MYTGAAKLRWHHVLRLLVQQVGDVKPYHVYVPVRLAWTRSASLLTWSEDRKQNSSPRLPHVTWVAAGGRRRAVLYRSYATRAVNRLHSLTGLCSLSLGNFVHPTSSPARAFFCVDTFISELSSAEQTRPGSSIPEYVWRCVNQICWDFRYANPTLTSIPAFCEKSATRVYSLR